MALLPPARVREARIPTIHLTYRTDVIKRAHAESVASRKSQFVMQHIQGSKHRWLRPKVVKMGAGPLRDRPGCLSQHAHSPESDHTHNGQPRYVAMHAEKRFFTDFDGVRRAFSRVNNRPSVVSSGVECFSTEILPQEGQP